MDKHELTCEYQLVPCTNNGFCCSVLRKDLSKHVNELCPFRQVSCLLLCGVRLPLNEVD
jgi:hypothetical protein